jgi:hypothetical protein
MEMWRSGAIQCVLLIREASPGVVVEVRREGRVLATTRCDDPDCAAVEAERLYSAVVSVGSGDFVPGWEHSHRRRIARSSTALRRQREVEDAERQDRPAASTRKGPIQ